jgi:hypothetical protein
MPFALQLQRVWLELVIRRKRFINSFFILAQIILINIRKYSLRQRGYGFIPALKSADFSEILLKGIKETVRGEG